MSFQSPLALIGLVLVPVLVGLYVFRERRRQSYAARFGTPALLPNLVSTTPGWRRHLPLALFLVALAAMVVGVARPRASVSVQREEATVLIAIDSSLSMSSQDVRPSRLAAARSAAQAFVDGMPKKFRVGVIGFAGRAYVAVAPTEDRGLVRSALNSLKPGQGTALGDAVALGTRLARAERTGEHRLGHGGPDHPRMDGYRLQDALPDPPYRKRNEFESAGIVEPLGGLYQPEISFIDEIGKGETLALVLFSHRDDKPEISLDEVVQGMFVSIPDQGGEARLFFR